jgi:hypothetical protein
MLAEVAFPLARLLKPVIFSFPQETHEYARLKANSSTSNIESHVQMLSVEIHLLFISKKMEMRAYAQAITGIIHRKLNRFLPALHLVNCIGNKIFSWYHAEKLVILKG